MEKTYIIKIKDASPKETLAIIQSLIKDEDDAIKAYAKAIETIQDPHMQEVFKHIMDEEVEHKRELEELLK